MPPRFIARHLARPTGWLGGVVAQLMNWNNGKPNLFAVQQLQLSSTDRVLEIGFGGGIILPVNPKARNLCAVWIIPQMP